MNRRRIFWITSVALAGVMACFAFGMFNRYWQWHRLKAQGVQIEIYEPLPQFKAALLKALSKTGLDPRPVRGCFYLFGHPEYAVRCHGPLTQSGAALLSGWPVEHAVALELWETPFEPELLAVLGPMPNLEALTIGGAPVAEEAIARIGKEAPNLGEVSIGNTAFTGDGFRDWTVNPNTNGAFFLADTKLTNQGLGYLVRARPDIYLLELDRTSVSDESADSLFQLKMLEQVLLDDTAVSIETLKVIQNLPKLTSVWVGGTNVKAEEFLTLSPAFLDRLTSLSVGGLDFDDEQVGRLVDSCPNLEGLTLNGSPIGDPAVSHFLRLKHLRNLHLDHTAITSKSVPLLDRLSCTGLSVNHTKLSEEEQSKLWRY